MSKQTKPIHDPSNGLADKVFWRVFIASFICVIIGVADPMLNESFQNSINEDAGRFERLINSLIYPKNMMRELRSDGMFILVPMAAVLSLFPALLLGGLTYFGAVLEDRESTKSKEQNF